MEFKDYKEKQEYFKNRSKESKIVWISKMNDNKNKIIKGRTYVKPKEVNENDNDTN